MPQTEARCQECNESEVMNRRPFLDENYCQYCYNNRYRHCNCCGGELARRSDRSFESYGDVFCRDCYQEQSIPCSHCSDLTTYSQIIRDSSHAPWCRGCHEANFGECDNCEVTYPLSQLSYGSCNGCSRRSTWDHQGFFVEQPNTTELRSGRRFGIEIETSSCPGHPSIRTDTVFGCKTDGSIDGMEFVSPILYGDEGLAEVQKICGHAHRLNWEIDSACGLHLHVDLTDESHENCFKLAYAYMHSYDFWTSFISDARKRNYYCAKHKYNDGDVIRYTDFQEWCNYASNGSRYDWVNWYAWIQHKTVELRHHTATLNGDKICSWVKAHTRFIDKVISMPDHDITRSLAGCDVHSQFEAISEWWDDEDLSEYYADRANQFSKPFRRTTLVHV